MTVTEHDRDCTDEHNGDGDVTHARLTKSGYSYKSCFTPDTWRIWFVQLCSAFVPSSSAAQFRAVTKASLESSILSLCPLAGYQM